MIPNYPSPQQLGTRHVADLFSGPVVVQEKIDGSQISFGVDADGNLHVKSRGGPINVLSPDKMFGPAIAKLTAIKHLLKPGFIFRGEYLSRPKHNVLAYDRVPLGNIVLFDVEVHSSYGHMDNVIHHVEPEAVKTFASLLDVEPVPVLFEGVTTQNDLRQFLDTTSVLGGAKVEGVVVKNYALAKTQEFFAAKFVSEAFKEIHTQNVFNTDSRANDTRTIDEAIIASFGTTARWAKAVQHLREAGKITDTPKDIGLLVKEVQSDIESECKEEIMERLWHAHRSNLTSGFVNGLAQWYKDVLLNLSHQNP